MDEYNLVAGDVGEVSHNVFGVRDGDSDAPKALSAVIIEPTVNAE